MGFLDWLRGKPDVENLKKRRDVEGLIRALSHKDWEVRRQAAEALGGFRDQRAVTALIIKALHDNVGRVRDEAARSLEIIKDPSSVKLLLETIRSSPSVKVCLYAVRILGAMGGPDSVQALKIVLEERSWEVHHEAAKALNTIAETSIDPSIRADISAALEKAERDRSDEYRKFRIFEELKSVPGYSVTISHAQVIVSWPNVCCLCLGPVEKRVEVAGTGFLLGSMRRNGSIRQVQVSVKGVPYCKFCSALDWNISAVEIVPRDWGVTFVFKNPEYGKMFLMANQPLAHEG